MPENCTHLCIQRCRRGWLEHTEEVELGESGGSAWSTSHPASAAEGTAPENQVTSGKVVHMTPSSWPQGHPCLQRTRQQWKWGLRPHPSSHGGTHNPRPPAHSNGTCKSDNPRHGRGSCNLAPLPPSLSPCSGGAWDPGDSRQKGGDHPSNTQGGDTSKTSSSKEPMTERHKQQWWGHQVTTLAEVVEDGKCPFSNKTRISTSVGETG